ncbi:TrmB family transcriptional regulator [Desulfospira joergensenii]|uniref:TrmB family transcriptional regulator n=1 Tax=Desulfospira joergensenii TaxID=53329 RepID=UPI0003B605DA|nr:helix-turn-helix domain-containing protein [Desulfospira joergensenii]
MENKSKLKELGFSQYEAACYMALVRNHPVNGSQLSKISGIARSRIYDVLRSLTAKGYVIEVSTGLYSPLPSDELIRRLKLGFENNILAFEKEIQKASQKDEFEFVWTLTGYDNVMNKAIEMIRSARKEIYVRLFPEADNRLGKDLEKAHERGVAIRYIAMGKIDRQFDIQVIHPDHENLVESIGGRSFDIITDRKEALVGIFEVGNEDESPINWTRNQWFVIANRDSLKHDFYHCFLEKTLDRGQKLTDQEKKIYKLIKADH